MTKTNYVNEILKLKPHFIKTQSQLFSMQLSELQELYLSLCKRQNKN